MQMSLSDSGVGHEAGRVTHTYRERMEPHACESGESGVALTKMPAHTVA